MKAYGDYRTFDHEPNDAEIKETVSEILNSLIDELKKSAVVKESENEWTVGFRLIV